jgi:serine phosphatase RsbU (regulator of sigma subunit)
MDLLEIVDGQGLRRQISLDRPRLLIGREPSCEICLAHPNVSRRHAQLQRTDDGRWLLQDLNSLSGIRFDDRPVQQIVLEPGQPVRIAEYRLVLLRPAATPAGSPFPPEKPAQADLDPDWLARLLSFQHALVRLDDPRAVLQELAETIQRIVQPQMVAVGLNTPAGYSWPVQLGEIVDSAPHDEESSPSEESDPRVWTIETDRASPRGEAAAQTWAEEECGELGKILQNNHAKRVYSAEDHHILVGALRDPQSGARQAISQGFHRVVILDIEQGLDRAHQFDVERFLSYVMNELVVVFDLDPASATYPEDVFQILSDEPRPLFCFINAQHTSLTSLCRLRPFTQTRHQVLMISRGEAAGGPLLVPIQGRSGVLGHVFVRWPRLAPQMPALPRYLSVYANYAGLLFESLQAAPERADQKEWEGELHRVRQFQIEAFPSLTSIDPRLDAFAVNLPSAKISGDYYDVVKTGPDTFGFLIADGMGHGMSAALMMNSVRTAFRMGLTLGLSARDLFNSLDHIVNQRGGNRFATGVVGWIDLARRELCVVVAGHPVPALLIGGKPVPVPAECQTRPWGLDFEIAWQEARLPLGDGNWTILCYTDGITDTARSTVPEQRRYGVEDVVAFLANHLHDSAEDLCQRLLSEVAGQQHSPALEDDQTVLVLRSK